MNKYSIASFVVVAAVWAGYLFTGYIPLSVAIATHLAVVVGTAAVVSFLDGQQPELDLELLDFGPWLLMLWTVPIWSLILGYLYYTGFQLILDGYAVAYGTGIAVISLVVTMITVLVLSAICFSIGVKYHSPKTERVGMPFGFGE